MTWSNVIAYRVLYSVYTGLSARRELLIRGNLGVCAVAHDLDVNNTARPRRVERDEFTREHAQRCAITDGFQ
jgi:hypothetical protein